MRSVISANGLSNATAELRSSERDIFAATSNSQCLYLKIHGTSHRSFKSEGGLSLDSRSAEKELKVVTTETSKVCVTTIG